jgi:prolyl 4-hydroxylase
MTINNQDNKKSGHHGGVVLVLISAVIVLIAIVWQQININSKANPTTSSMDLFSSIKSKIKSVLSPDECSFSLTTSLFFSLEEYDDTYCGSSNDGNSGGGNGHVDNGSKGGLVCRPKYDCTHDDLSKFLHDDMEMAGMHLVCLHRHNRSMTFFRGTTLNKFKTVSFGSVDRDTGKKSDGNNNEATTTWQGGDVQWERLSTWASMRSVIHTGLELDLSDPRIVPYGPERPRDNWKQQFSHPPWSVYSLEGHRLVQQDSSTCSSTRPLWETGMFLVMEGGQFVWPGVRVGFKREISIAKTMGKGGISSSGNSGNNNHNVTLETLSLQPLIFSVDEFFADEECTYVREAAQPKLKYPDTVLNDKDDGKVFSGLRTSSSMVLNIIEPPLQELTHRISRLARVHETQLEPTSVSKFRIGEYYGPHHDYFEPTMYKRDPATLRLLRNGYRNRLATVFWYLSDLPPNNDKDDNDNNGVTTFPMMPQVPIDEACTTGLQVSPRKGQIVIMYNLNPDGSVDPLTLNADCPVQRGVKWTASTWVWNQPVLPTRYA